MKTYILIRVLLAIHLSALTVMAGTTVIDFVTFRTFWEKAEQGGSEARGLLPIISKYGAIVRASGAILLISGIAMLTLVHGAWTQQLWFKIKMVLVILLIANGVFIGNRNGISLRQMASEYTPDFIHQSAGVRANLNRFYITQLVLFFSIILVSALKFDNA